VSQKLILYLCLKDFSQETRNLQINMVEEISEGAEAASNLLPITCQEA